MAAEMQETVGKAFAALSLIGAVRDALCIGSEVSGLSGQSGIYISAASAGVVILPTPPDDIIRFCCVPGIIALQGVWSPGDTRVENLARGSINAKWESLRRAQVVAVGGGDTQTISVQDLRPVPLVNSLAPIDPGPALPILQRLVELDGTASMPFYLSSRLPFICHHVCLLSQKDLLVDFG